MIQFYHFHNSARRYVDLIGEKKPELANSYLSVMNVLSNFKRSNGSCFAYVPLDGKSYFIQTNSVDEEFAHGLIGNVEELKYEPSRYIGTLQKSFMEQSETQVGERPLPVAKDFQLSSTKRLHSHIPAIVDSLLYSDKLVVITGKNESDLIDCVKTVFKVLPLSFSSNTGFTVAPSKIPNIFDERMGIIKGKLRLIATTAECYKSDALVVINIDSANNSQPVLNPYSRVLAHYDNDLSSNRLTGFLTRVSSCFNGDGSFDKKAVARAALIKLFDDLQNSETAIELLNSAEDLGIEPIDTIGPIEYLLSQNVVTEEAIKAIEKARQNERVKSQTINVYGRFNLGSLLQGHALSEEQRLSVAEYIANCAEVDYANLQSTFNSADKNKDIFWVLSKAYSLAHSAEIAKLIISYTDINATFNAGKEIVKGKNTVRDRFTENLLTIINTVNANEIHAMCAAILATCNSANREKSKYRFKTFRRYSENKFTDIKERILFLLGVKRELAVCNRMMGAVTVVEDIDFLPVEWLNSLTSKEVLSFADCLDLVANFSEELSVYSQLRTQIIERLQNLEEIKENVSFDRLLEEYKSFLSEYKPQIIAYDEIEAYIESLDNKMSAFAEFSDYRCNYVLSSYKAMIKTGKANDVLRKVRREYSEYSIDGKVDQIEQDLADPNADMNKRQLIAEKVIEVLAGNCRVEKSDSSTNNGKYFFFAFLISFVCMAIASAILIVPQGVFAYILGEDILNRILLNLKIYHVIAIVAIGLLNFISYVICWNKSNHNRTGSIKKALAISVLYVGLPILAYEIAYLTIYLI